MQRLPIPISASLLTGSAATYYTVPPSTVATVSNLSFTNTSASPVAVTLYNVPNAGTAGTSNTILSAFSLSPGQSYVPPQVIGLQMGAGATLQAFAATASVVTISGGVYETSGS